MNKITEKEAKKPDKFLELSELLGHWMEKHRKIIGGLFISGILVGSGIGLGSLYASYQEKKAQESLYQTESKIEKLKTDLEKKRKDKKEVVAHDKPDMVRDYGTLPEELKNKIKKFCHTKAGVLSSIRLASLFFDYSQYDKALELLKEVSSQVPSKGLLSGLIHMQMGSNLIGIEKYEEAKKQFNQVLSDESIRFLHSESILKLGLCEEKLGHQKEARDYYLRDSQEFASTEAGKTAKNYLRLLDASQIMVKE